MEFTIELANQLLQAVLQLLLNPFYYVGIVLIIYQFHKQISLERKHFHTRLHSIVQETWRMLLWGWVCGLFASLVMAFLGASIPETFVYLLWGLSMILFLFRARLFCFAYSIGIIGMLQGILSLFPQVNEVSSLQWLIQPLEQVSMPALLALVGIIHLIEALLVRTQSWWMAIPIIVNSKRGKSVGGNQLNGFWILPLFLLVPISSGTPGSLTLPWSPLFSSGLGVEGWGFIALPVVIGFTEISLVYLPKDKLLKSSNLLLLFAGVLLISAVVSYYWSPFIWIGSLVAIFLHEGLRVYSRLDEVKRSPLFVNTLQGLKILAVLPGSPAAELGLLPGEIVHKVNNERVWTKQALYQAMQINPAFVRMEVINLEGHSKFVSKALYAGDHHQLGMLLSPDVE